MEKPKPKSQYNETDIFLHFWYHRTDKADNGYATFYEKIFNGKHPKSILEIGIRHGGCLVAFKNMFPEARVVGVDINPPGIERQKEYAVKGVEWYQCDATQPILFDFIGDEPFDLIIDDGSHFYKHQRESFELLKDKFNDYYVIEDVMWRHDETEKYINTFGYKVERYQNEFQPTVTNSVEFLENNEGNFYNPAYGRRVSNRYNLDHEHVTTPMEFWTIKQLT